MTEQLNVLEEHLLEVCKVIRAGVKELEYKRQVSPEVRVQLLKWCDEEERYMRECEEEDANA